MKLHPALQTWFDTRFGPRAFTDIQKLALKHTLKWRNVLILAPTGSGKTLSAFLSVLSELAREAESKAGLPNAVCAVYVSPLRSLDRDIHRNLQSPLEAINAALPFDRRIRMEVRTGDTEQKERGYQQRRRPHLLLTTPESLAGLLSQRGWMDGFDPRAVVVDEIHSFCEGKRGTHLALTMERLEERAKDGLQRIGLSATAWPVHVIQKLLCGDRPCEVASVDVRKAHELRIGVPAKGDWLPPAGHNPYRIAGVAADLVAKANCTILFTTTRSASERLGLALTLLLPDDEERIAVHHSSIERSERLRIEEGLSAGQYKAVVASSSLELGVDFQAVDQVLLIGTPRGVSRTLQRLGRSGHRVGGVARGYLLPTSVPDLLQSVALRRSAAEGRLDALRVPAGPLDVLSQTLLGMSIERPWRLSDAYETVTRAGPYLDLSLEDFEACIEYLAGGGRVLGPYGTYGKIIVEDGTFRVASRKVSREYYMNIGTISDDFQIKVVNKGNRRLGEVEEGFLAALQPGEAFTIGGRAVVLERLHQTTAIVKPAQGERVQTPRWMGPRMPLTAQLADEERHLRRDLRKAWDAGGAGECERILRKEWGTDEPVTERVIAYLERQNKAAPIPADEPVLIERVREGRSLLMLFHVVAGRAVNRSLAWVVAHRLGVSGSVVANHDDHAFLLSVSPKDQPSEAQLRAAFNPTGFRVDLQTALERTETLGRQFRPVAEIGQLLPRRTYRGLTPARASSWNGSLLYTTLRLHEPEHPLVREAIRATMEDMMDVDRAEAEAGRLFEAKWEIYDLPRPTPFGLELFAAFSRETLLAQDPDRALDELVNALYEQWDDDAPEPAPASAPRRPMGSRKR
ncbi:MAG: DEAD/DEAH box helicase, partial [Bryobacteraceae bacterium]|nr:DEAD/DEAH box helicase [Bryobacteraceae bacterium]